MAKHEYDNTSDIFRDDDDWKDFEKMVTDVKRKLASGEMPPPPKRQPGTADLADAEIFKKKE